MAVTIISPIEQYMFTSELLMFRYKTTASSSTVSITTEDNHTILSCAYTPDESGVVTIYDLNKILEDNIDESFAKFKFLIETDPARTISVIRATIAIDNQACTFIANNFLSCAVGPKEISCNSHEILSIFPIADCDVSAECTYYFNGKLIDAHIDIVTIPKADSVIPIVVSPNRFIDKSKGDLIGYTIKAGIREQKYSVIQTFNKDCVNLMFKNCFGAWETISLSGSVNHEPEYVRSSAYINATLVNYAIEVTDIFKVSTGILNRNIIQMALDLARSSEVYILKSDGTTGDRLVITESDAKYSDDDNALTSFVFTCRLASRISSKLRLQEPVNIFDNKFDFTYE